MGKPATTYFCGNGHLVEDNTHHEFGPRDSFGFGNDNDEKMPCPICKTNEIHCVTEWHDEGYWENGDINQLVPHKPIRQDEIRKRDHKGNEYFQLVDVFDVSKLKKNRTEKK